jgi:hypothetical protein
VVAEQAGFALSFFLDGGRRQHEFFQVGDQEVRKNDPELALNKFCHFFPQKLGVIHGGSMASTVDASVFLVR